MKSSRSQVVVTDYFPSPEVEATILSPKGFSVAIEGSGTVNPDSVVGLLVWHRRIDPTYMSRFPNLRAIVRYGVGVDNLNLRHMAQKKIRVANTTDYGIEEVADHSIALALYGLRGLGHSRSVVESLADDSWQHNLPPGIRRFSEMTFGILGLGRIGALVALKAKSLGFKVQFFDPYVPPGADKTLGISRVKSLKSFAMSSDTVSVHVDLNHSTLGIISRELIQQMPNGSILVNTSRGKVVSELADLLDHLESGKLAFAGLDVLPDEPFCQNSPDFERANSLVQSGKLLITPHVGFYSEKSIVEMREIAATTMLSLLSGQESPYELSDTLVN